MWNPSLFFISNRFYKTQSNLGLLNDPRETITSLYGIFMGCHHDTGRAQYWHLAVTCNITVAIVKTIEICGVFAISDNTKLILGLCNMNEWWR